MPCRAVINPLFADGAAAVFLILSHPVGRGMTAECSSKCATEIRTALARGACLAAMALCVGTSAVPARASEVALIANACWEYKRFIERDIRGAIETKLDGSHLICFQPRGWATGETFHGHDAWDWSVRYKIANHVIFLDDEVFGRVISVDLDRMIVADGDERRSYRYVCRAAAKNIQCERLRERHFRR
jgi:hypothetical protein